MQWRRGGGGAEETRPGRRGGRRGGSCGGDAERGAEAMAEARTPGRGKEKGGAKEAAGDEPRPPLRHHDHDLGAGGGDASGEQPVGVGSGERPARL